MPCELRTERLVGLDVAVKCRSRPLASTQSNINPGSINIWPDRQATGLSFFDLP